MLSSSVSGCSSETVSSRDAIKGSENKNKLSCMYFNARSIMNKLDELELYVRDENLDIVGITETWLTASVLSSEVSIEGYTLLRKDRNDANKTRGGGVALYINDEITIVEREDLYEQLFPESVWCTVISKKEKTLIGVCYRAPDSLNINDDALYLLINRASRDNVVIMGDFNFPELKWDNMNNMIENHPFINCLNDNFLEQIVREPTRAKNFLDLILSSDANFVQNVSVGEPFVSSDHQIIRFNLIVMKEEKEENKISYNYFKADYNKVRAYIKCSEDNNKTREDNRDIRSVDMLWNSVQEKLVDAKEKFVPKTKKSKNKCKWVTKDVVKCRRAKKKAWNNYIKSGRNLFLYEVYKSKLRESVTCNNKAKEEFELKLANNIKQDCKSFYAYVRSKQRCKDKVGPLKDDLGNVINSDKVTADILNKYFSTVFTKEDKTTIPVAAQIFVGDVAAEGLTNIEITDELVFKKLQDLNVNKSPGVDDLHPKLLYELRTELSRPLAQLFQLSLEMGIIPQDWRDANVTPLFKKGSKDRPENYRPISLTSLVGKMLESIIKDNILQHLVKFKLIFDSQHGFSKGRSCLTNLLDFMEDVTKNLDEGKPVDVIYLDFAKAFDKVPYCRLFEKLKAHGIGGQVLQWIERWLSGRRQRVSVNKTFSDWEEVTSGVPQGSVLGPVLFLIYINDIDMGLVSKLSKFADDSKLCKTICSDEDREALQNDLNKLSDWTKLWQMKFNIDKCVVVHLGHNNEHLTYTLDGNDLKISEKERDLGIIVDNSGKWSEQCNAAVKNANSTLGIIKRHVKSRKKDIMLKLYKSLVRPKLEYCVQVWRPHLKKDIDNLEKVQHRATKLISGCRDLKYERRLISCGLISLEKRRERGDLIQVFKLVKGLDNIDYRRFFELASNSKTRGHSLKMTRRQSRLDIRLKYFSQRVVNSWNSLPENVVAAETVNCFKNSLDRYWATQRGNDS